jgi:hypothetical protein
VTVATVNPPRSGIYRGGVLVSDAEEPKGGGFVGRSPIKVRARQGAVFSTLQFAAVERRPSYRARIQKFQEPEAR